MEIVDYFEDGSATTVIVPHPELLQDYERQAHILAQATQQIEVNKERMATDDIAKCDNRFFSNDTHQAGYFFPVYVGSLNEAEQSTHYTSGLCFQDLTFTYTDSGNPEDIGDVTVTIQSSKAKSLMCKDWFFFATVNLYHFQTISSKGSHSVTFTNLSPDAKIDIMRNGIKVYMMCDGYVDTFISVLNTLLAFIGGISSDPTKPIAGSHVPPYMEKANVEFLHNTMNYNLVERETKEYDYDLSNIHSGDFFAVTRLDGIDPIIMYGSGSHTGHSVMALWIDGELNIVESQDGWYWPKHGIQRNLFPQWIEWARNADFHVVHMPLSPEARAKFDEQAAIKFFLEAEGLPYGYHNFLFGWIDTPSDNFPPLLPKGFVPVVFSILEHVLPSTVDIFFSQAINKRLGTKGLSIPQQSVEAAKVNKSIEDLMAEVEVEGWIYEGLTNDGRAYVCSAFVAALWQAAGLLHNINSPELAPKDVYTINVFDLNYQRPAACQAADPDQPFCQILGKYRMTFPGYSTIEPYEHMAEHCPTMAPDYFRPDGC